MGRLRLRERSVALPDAGELCAVEALDREGLLITREGAFVRYLRVTPKNPLVMSQAEREQVGHALGQLVGRLGAGQSLQFYVEAAPVRLPTLLEHSRAEAERAQRALRDGAGARAQALRRLHAALCESLDRHSQAQAAVDIAYYVIVPHVPDRRVRIDWRELVRVRRPRLSAGALERSLESHRRLAQESLHVTDSIRGDLEALDLSTHMLSGPEVLDLLWRRFNPTAADRTPNRRPAAQEQRLELVGELDAVTDAREAARAAHALRELVAGSAIDCADQRHLRVDRDLEQALYVATLPDATEFGWLLDAMQVQRPFTLTVYVHALDRLRERARFKARHRRLFGVNRGAELRGRTPDYEMLAQEEEFSELLKELSGHERASAFEVSIYQSIRERGPNPDPVQLAEAVEQATREVIAASDARVNTGQLRQLELWQSSLPLGRDLARMTRKYVTRHVGDTVPLVGTGCGSPLGIPFAFTDPGREVALINPFDPAHDNGTLLINARSGGGKTFLVNVLVARLLAHGMQAFVLDRAGHYEFLCRLVPGAQHLLIGASSDDHAVNPWDVEDPANPPIEKISYLVALHALLVGDHRAGDDSYGLDALERNLLEVAIRSVYARATREEIVPREALLRQELRRRADDEAKAGAEEVASALRTLGERIASFVDDGSYAYLLDRETTVPADAPLVAFDTRKVPRELQAAVLFVLAEHVTRRIESRGLERLREANGGVFAGRSMLVIDEAWKLVERRATGEWVNEIARRSRHLGLFLVAISQQLSDFAGPYGKALLRNSTQQLFLRQSPDELAYIKDAARLSDAEVRAIARLKTVKRSYSQAYWINGTRGRGTIALRVGPTEYGLATSDPVNDLPRRTQVLDTCDGDAWRALEQLAAEGWEAHR
ncbi:MAG: VirB4 family type IV secretion system protein [Solirubrobacteraceae bacterium]